MSELKVKEGDTIAVWFSSGIASAIAAKETIDKYKETCTIRIVNNPVIEEHSDNLRFLDDVQNWLDHEVEYAVNSKFPDCSAVSVWGKRKYMSNCKGEAPCTFELKKKARAEFEQSNDIDWHVLGFSAEETHRYERLKKAELPELLPVLIDSGLTKETCFYRMAEAGIARPFIYEHGFPNANCIGCVKATSPTYWNLVRREFPEVFKQRADQSGEIGARLVRVKGERIYLHDLDPKAKGRPLKNYHIECGIFCEKDNLRGNDE